MSDVGHSKIKIYVAHAMTGKNKHDLCAERDFTTFSLELAGFEVLDPITAENVADVNEPLTQTSQEQLANYWKRDKEMIKEADIILDYQSCNKSDGVSKEIGYARFCLWKPVVRVFPGMGINISRLEDDIITDDLGSAIFAIKQTFGTYEQLREWRTAMWRRCYDSWLAEQQKMNDRYNVMTSIGK